METTIKRSKFHWRKFHFTTYWRTWNRVLTNSNPFCDKNVFVVIGLTPPNNHRREWEEIANVRFYKSDGSSNPFMPGYSSPEDSIALPTEIIKRMEDNLDPLMINYLLHHDFLPEIDWNLFDKRYNGGVMLEDCRKR